MDIRPLLIAGLKKGHGVEPGFRSVGGTVSPFVLSVPQTSAGYFSFRSWSGACVLCGMAQEIGVVVTALCEQAPGHAREFCGQGNDQYIRVEPLGRCFQPGSEAVLGPGLAPQKYGSG